VPERIREGLEKILRDRGNDLPSADNRKTPSCAFIEPYQLSWTIYVSNTWVTVKELFGSWCYSSLCRCCGRFRCCDY
jgi:hypothetical protein